jgi:hypothetical protein
MLKRWIIHPFAFAIFPILALLSHNITEVSPRVALRSIAISLAITLILLLLVYLVSRDWKKSALATTLFLFLFFSYGQVYELLQQHPVFGFSLGRHRFLAIGYALIFIAGLWLIFRKSKDLSMATQAMNMIGLLLLVFPIVNIVNQTVRTSLKQQHLAGNSLNLDSTSMSVPRNMPDVYLIVLDGYARGDALQQDFGFDNSAFLQNLRGMGFYVADCSRANDGSTHGSFTTALNMDYLPALRSELAAQGLTNSEDVWSLIKQSRVRNLLESIGYQTIAFESGFEWSRLRDADVYLEYTGAPIEMQVLQPFEAMLIRSTALLLWSDSTYKSLPAYTHTIFGATNFPFESHINRQLFILDQLPRLASFPGPKFVFVHILIPHLPFVFRPDGSIQTDTGFYSKDNFSPIDEEHIVNGYIDQIQFVNSRMIPILQTIIDQSDVPPIIVLMGDHGLNKDNRLLNLNAYYLPDKGEQALYPGITPVNSFRLIFDKYFNTDYGLLPDTSYSETGAVVPETYPNCIEK